jgi:hypothetical protein
MSNPEKSPVHKRQRVISPPPESRVPLHAFMHLPVTARGKAEWNRGMASNPQAWESRCSSWKKSLVDAHFDSQVCIMNYSRGTVTETPFLAFTRTVVRTL